MNEYKKYLTDRLLSEEQPVTYRLLSRALDVHVNTAKEMLYDYHVYQNAQKPESIHATYLVYGKKAGAKPIEEGDVEMGSSMPEEEPSEEIPTSTMTLAREEQLKDILAEYQDVTSLHVYSLAPHPQRDLSLLADVSKSLAEYRIKDQDVAEAAKKYGSISNAHVRKRDRKAKPIATASNTGGSSKSQAAPVKVEPKAEPKATQPKPAPESTKVKQEPAAESSSKDKTAAPKEKAPTSSAAKAPPSLKKGGSEGIMQSFAKTKPPKPKPEVKKEEDTAMALSDDGEADDDDMPETKKEDKGESLRKTKQQREDELRRMMEEDEEEEEEEEPEEKDDPADAEMEEAPEPEPEPEPKPETKEDKEPSEMISSTENGRRRGKRKVMQKKRILDDQGYMVTIQEPGWESFSEDEAPPPTKKSTATSTPASSAGKPKKPAGKGAQGNIMSFFGKK